MNFGGAAVSGARETWHFEGYRSLAIAESLGVQGATLLLG